MKAKREEMNPILGRKRNQKSVTSRANRRPKILSNEYKIQVITINIKGVNLAFESQMQMGLQIPIVFC